MTKRGSGSVGALEPPPIHHPSEEVLEVVDVRLQVEGHEPIGVDLPRLLRGGHASVGVAFVDVALELVRVSRRGHTLYGLGAAQDAIAHAQNHSAAAAIRHAHRHVHGLADGLAVIGWPFLEVEILPLQLVCLDFVEPGEQ